MQTINENGKVSFVSKMIPVFSSSSSWWIWVSWFIVLLISILVTWLIFANEEFVIWQQVLRIAVQSFVLWFVLMLIMICVCNTPSKPMDNGALVYFEGFSVGVWVLILLGASVCFVTFTVLTFSLIEHLKKRESKR